MKKGVQHINCNIFGCDLEETRFNFSWGPRAVRGSSESCGPLNHCSHELVGGGGVGWPLLAVCLIIWATLLLGHKWVMMELPSQPIAATVSIVQRWLSCYLASGLPPIQFQGVNYLCRSWQRVIQSQEVSYLGISMQILKSLAGHFFPCLVYHLCSKNVGQEFYIDFASTFCCRRAGAILLPITLKIMF